jgi:phage terminase large subunit
LSSSVRFKAQFPEKAAALFQPSRYKDIRGGRGSAKSWSVARTLLIQGADKPLRILCTREVQQSIRDSVHKLLSDQIETLGLGSLYDIEQRSIRGKSGTEFLFAGLSDQTAESLKSFEGVDIVWLEEAQVLTKRSWTILVPTIRKLGSEIWATWNPELDTDETYLRLVENPPDDIIHIVLNWRDNPWFNSVLNAERLHAQATTPTDEYENVWEGKCRKAISGAIYADEVVALHDEHRVGDYPVDPFHLVYPCFDLGWNDQMSIVLVQRQVSQIRIVGYIEDSHKTLDWYSKALRDLNYSWGKVFLPHDGAHKDYKTGRSAQEIMEDLKWTVEVLPSSSVEEGIRATRMMLKQTFIDRGKCARLLECLKRYRRSIPKSTGEPATPLHDEFSHGADAMRYVAMAAPQMDNELQMKLPPLKYGRTGIP